MTEFTRDDRLEFISDQIRKGIPVGLYEAIEAIDYQNRLKEYKNKKWWKKILNWFKK